MSNRTTTYTVHPSRAALEQLETQVQSRLKGWVRNFRLVLCGQSLVLQGYAHTYYAKQLAQQAVLAATTLPIRANEIQVR